MTIQETGIEIPTPYEDLLRDVLKNGTFKYDRTGVGTLGVFCREMRFNLAEGFPLITTKYVNYHAVFIEVMWFLRGDANIRYLLQNNVHIWSEWPYKAYLKKTGQPVPDPDSNEWKVGLKEFEQRIIDDEEFAKGYGEVGEVYGAQWRRWKKTDGGELDQIEELIERLKTDPNSRRHLVTAWNPEFVPTAALPPCHVMFQFNVTNGKLSCFLFQRSCDMFLGVPFNIASYALITMLIAHVAELELGEFVWYGGDVHIYRNHFDQVDLQLEQDVHKYPTVRIVGKHTSLSDIHYDRDPSKSDVVVEDYVHGPTIRGAVAV